MKAEKAQKTLEKERDEKTKSIRDLQVCLHFQHSNTCTYIMYLQYSISEILHVQGKHDRLASSIQELETKLAEITTRNETLATQH